MTRHMKVHSGENENVCEYCFKPFPSEEKLSRHIKIHTEQQPFVCEYCQKQFSRLTNMIRHRTTIHTRTTQIKGEEEFPTDIFEMLKSKF